MTSKGIVWMPAAIGIIFLAQILIFSFAFSQVTIFSREVIDSNIVFEGDELETYARSITNSVQLSTSQSIYDFYMDHRFAFWQLQGSSLVPDKVSVNAQLNRNFNRYAGTFFQEHENFDKSLDGDIRFTSSGNSEVRVGDDHVYAKFFDEVSLEKGPIRFADATYNRKFVPESKLITVFGKMMKKIRGEFIGGDMVGISVREAIGKENGKNSCNVNSPREGFSNELGFYIDDDATSGKMSKNSYYETTGWMEFCSSQSTVFEGCLSSNPCPQNAPAVEEPTPEDVYTHSHNEKTFSSGQSLIEGYAKERVLCLEAELDGETEDYTVAFDGDNLNPTPTDPVIQTKALIESPSCGLENIGKCAGFRKKVCAWKDGRPIKWDYYCHIYKKKTCEYDHFATGEIHARFQEDGFVYGFVKEENMVADNIKIVFKARSGNADLL